MAEMHSVDDLLNTANSATPATDEAPIESHQSAQEPAQSHQMHQDEINDYSYSQDEKPQSIESIPDKTDETPASLVETDEYGNAVTNEQKMLTMEEHQRLLNEAIRKRIKNWAPEAQEQMMAQLNQPQPAQQMQQDGEVDWQQELKSLVKTTMLEAQQEAARAIQQQEELTKYQEFEGKFNTGATRYNDFEDVVMTKPLSPAMLKATQNMNDPAAFVYAACKTQAQEVERIAKLKDPIQQAVEIGKLEERMRKVRSATKAAAPIEPSASDITDKHRGGSRDIDSLIFEHAKTKRR